MLDTMSHDVSPDLRRKAKNAWPSFEVYPPSAQRVVPHRPSNTPVRRCRASARTGGPYPIESYTLNSGRYIEMTMKPTMPPTKTIMTGSRMEVRALTEASTWSS